MTPGDVSVVIDTTGFDYMTYHVGEGTLPSSGTTTFALRGAMDSNATTTGSIATEAGIHAPASVGTGATSRVWGYLSKLPRYLIVSAQSGSATSVDVWVELRKTNVLSKGRG